MPFDKNGDKWACGPCIKGHRSTKCTHYDRFMLRVRKPGRPLTNCPHEKDASGVQSCSCKPEKYMMVEVKVSRNECICVPQEEYNRAWATGLNTSNLPAPISPPTGDLAGKVSTPPAFPQAVTPNGLYPGLFHPSGSTTPNGIYMGAVPPQYFPPQNGGATHMSPVMENSPFNYTQTGYGTPMPHTNGNHLHNTQPNTFQPINYAPTNQEPLKPESIASGYNLVGNGIQETLDTLQSQFTPTTPARRQRSPRNTLVPDRGSAGIQKKKANSKATQKKGPCCSKNKSPVPKHSAMPESVGEPSSSSAPVSTPTNLEDLCLCGPECNCAFCPVHPHNTMTQREVVQLVRHLHEESETDTKTENHSPAMDLTLTPNLEDHMFDKYENVVYHISTDDFNHAIFGLDEVEDYPELDFNLDQHQQLDLGDPIGDPAQYGSPSTNGTQPF